MTTTITADQLMAEMQSEISRFSEQKHTPTTSPEEVADMYFGTPCASVPSTKKEYKEIIGVPHPHGEYYFTVYKDTDWSEEVRDLIPEVDDHHVFDHEYTLMILMAIEYNKIGFAYGPPGSGKSVTPTQVCARIRYPFMFIAGMGGTEPSDYVGTPWLEDGNMAWKDGPASFAVRHGVFLLYDEPFKSSAQTNMCFQSLMDTRRTLKLYGHPDPINGSLVAHPKFRMVLADNVRGFGDSMDKYAAEVQDQSTLNRCAYKVHVDYVPENIEVEILKRKFPDAKEPLLKNIVKLANRIREGWKKGEITPPYSVRDTQEFTEAALIHRDVGRAFTQTYLGAINDESESAALRKLFQVVFGSTATL